MSEIKRPDPESWLPPVYEQAIEFPSKITALTQADGRTFAHLEDGRTVDISSLVGDPKPQ